MIQTKMLKLSTKFFLTLIVFSLGFYGQNNFCLTFSKREIDVEKKERDEISSGSANLRTSTGASSSSIPYVYAPIPEDCLLDNSVLSAPQSVQTEQFDPQSQNTEEYVRPENIKELTKDEFIELYLKPILSQEQIRQIEERVIVQLLSTIKLRSGIVNGGLTLREYNSCWERFLNVLKLLFDNEDIRRCENRVEKIQMIITDLDQVLSCTKLLSLDLGGNLSECWLKRAQKFIDWNWELNFD